MKRLHSEDQESSSLQTVASSDDLLLQILLRLRFKHLVRLKLVSKHWNTLISDLELQPNRAAVGLLIPAINREHFFAYIAPFNKLDGTTYLPQRDNVEIEVMHGCNGLLVYSATENNTLNTQYFVINPTTMQRKMLPEPMRPERILAMCLAFDPSKSFRYKVVCVSGWKSHDHEECQYDSFQVYSSETGSWRHTSIQAFKGFLDVKNGVYWNGALHWISVSSSHDSIYFYPSDEDHQMLRVFPTPPTSPYPFWANHSHSGYFGESCGHLHFVGEMRDGVTVYEMKRDYSEWIVLHHVIWPLFEDRRVRGPQFVRTLLRGEKYKDCFLVLWHEMGIIRLNIASGAFERLRDLPRYSSEVPLPYIESICPV